MADQSRQATEKQAAASTGLRLVPEGPGERQKWEYAQLQWSGHSQSPSEGVVTYAQRREDENISDEGLWEALRRLGEEGWEMVGFAEQSYTGKEANFSRTFMFKRPL